MNYGGEYRCIAEALLRGEGFSDPFCSPGGNSGKTAWMPPFLSYFLAFLFIVFQGNTTVVTFVQIFLGTAAASFSLFLILRLANEVNSRFRHLCVPFFLVYLFINPGPFLLSFHDVWLISLMCIVSLYVLYFHFVKRSLSFTPVIFLALFLPLISPILSFAFLSVTGLLYLKAWVFSYLQQKSFKGLGKNGYSVYKFSAIILAFAVPIIFWGSRNYIVFNKFIPVKSNLWFDFYQANVFDEDGLITGLTFTGFHPMKSKVKLNEYKAIGEVELMDSLKNESLTYLSHHFPDYVNNVKNRLFSTFLISKNPFDEYYQIDEDALSASDIALLKESKILASNNSINVQLNEATSMNILMDLELDNKAQVISLWKEAKNKYESEYLSPSRFIESLLISGIPFLAWLFSLVFINQFKKEGRELFFVTSALYISYLVPYIMVTIYSRYVIPLSGIFSLILYFPVVLVLSKIFQPRSKKEPAGKIAVVRNPGVLENGGK